ncbi:MAG TPA: hypothetical protein PK078_06915 [Anaerolineales bacterium]|nr:hypothetical protein [Anaerolineales bacterium]HNA89841.1 hypothetical protein [Anaerolineales bacterium]HNB36570.1 hypothetical protein [Anaerolineales bacterium]
MNKYIGITWLVVTLISWVNFAVASWFWVDDMEPGLLVLVVLWFVISLILFLTGWQLRDRMTK